MPRRAWSLPVLGALAVLLAAWAASGDAVPLWHEPPPRFERTESPPPQPTVPPVTFPPPQQEPPSDGPDLTWLVNVIAAVLAIVAVVLLVRWLRRVKWRWPGRPPRRSAVDPLPDVAAALADAEAELHDALRDGTPRNAIVACWVRLEQTVRDAGVVPGPSETSTELTTRVLHGLSMDRGAIESLGSLYREARFSRHELGEAQRERAIAALTAVQADLQRTTAPPLSLSTPEPES